MDDADRRDYFRIADHVLLDYRVVTARTADEGAAADFFPPCHAFDLMRQLRLLEQEYGASRPASDQARDHDPALRSEEHTSELQSRGHLVCRLLLEKKKEAR